MRGSRPEHTTPQKLGKPISRHAAIRRSAVLLIVVGLHSLIVLVVWETRNPPRDRRSTEDRFVIWLATTTQQPPPPDATESSGPPVASSLAQPASIPAGSVTATDPAQLPDAQINWSANAAYQAKKWVEDSQMERYRNLGPRKPGPPPRQEVPSIFEAEPDVRGEEAEDVHGDPVVRLSKHCYQELEKRLPTARDYVNPGLPLFPKCMFPIGTPEPRGDLFEHLERDRPLPAPKIAEPQELPQRDPAHESQ